MNKKKPKKRSDVENKNVRTKKKALVCSRMSRGAVEIKQEISYLV